MKLHKKKVLALVLAVGIVIANIPITTFAADYSVGDTFTSDSSVTTPPTNIPEGTEWQGPQGVMTCTQTPHQHDDNCYCSKGGLSPFHWGHDDTCRAAESVCGYSEHIHSEENRCYSYAWTLGEATTFDQYRNWWPVYWSFEEGSSVTSPDVVKVNTGRDSVKFATDTVSASAGLGDVEVGETVNSGTVIANEGFAVTVDPGYYVVSWRLVCGNHFGCTTNDYQYRNYTANSDGDYTAEILVPMNGNSFDHWHGFDIQNSNSNGSYYVPVSAPSSTDSELYDSDTPYPFYLMVYVQQDTGTYQIDYDWGTLKGTLSEDMLPNSENSAVHNASYEVVSPNVKGGDAKANELGYRFVGWQISGKGYDEDATVRPGASITCYGSNITLIALWESTVTYQYTGEVPEDVENPPAAKHYEVDETVTVEDEPSASGYTFSGWTTDDVTVTDGKFTMPANPVIFIGSFAKNESQTEDEDKDEDKEPIRPVGPTPALDKGGDHLSYIIGYEDGTVRPLATITRAEVATIFFRLLTEESRADFWSQENPFPDVTADMWCNNAISTMFNAGIITGYPDGTFKPYAPVTRAEFAAIAARFSNEVSDGVSEFFDVSEDYWAFEHIALAEDLGWVQGYAGYFRPLDNMTRAEVMTTVNRVLERGVRKQNMLKDMIYWPDNTSDMWYYEAVQEATNSHTYKRTNVKVPNLDFYYEGWKKLLENPDWAALERAWSEANSIEKCIY